MKKNVDLRPASTSADADTPASAFRFPSLPVSAGHKETDPARGTITKAELAEALFEHMGLNKREAKDMVDGFFDEIRAALERGEDVKLSGFGNFQLRDKPQRPGRNPKTGEEIAITARRVVTFHASQKLKAVVATEQERLLAGANSSKAAAS